MFLCLFHMNNTRDTNGFPIFLYYGSHVKGKFQLITIALGADEATRTNMGKYYTSDESP